MECPKMGLGSNGKRTFWWVGGLGERGLLGRVVVGEGILILGYTAG